MLRRQRRVGGLLASVMLTGVLLVACGGGGDSGGTAYVEPKGSATEQLAIDAKNFSFTPDKLTAKPGIAKITLTSSGGLHDFVFDGAYAGFQLEVGTGDSDAKKIDLAKGTYTFYCSFSGHRAAGMEGTLTVK